MERQKTIKNEVTFSGIGLHNGKVTKVTIKPALPNSGINFIRTDLSERPVLNTGTSKIVDLHLCPRRTSIGVGDVEVQTIEHMMAALYGMGIDNARIELDSDEMPGVDGSAIPLLDILKKAEVAEQDAPKKYFSVKEPVWCSEGDAFILALPSPTYEISYTLSYDHPLLQSQYVQVSLDGNATLFEKQVAPARTFVLEREVTPLRQMGLGKGADYDNTLVVGNRRVIRNRVRFSDEFARHKILDLIGDLYLLGCPLRGRIIAIKSGHSLNVKLLSKLRQQRQKLLEPAVKAPDVQVGIGELDANMIQKILPHRYPFLLIDKVIEIERDRRAIGIKNVSINEEFFTGHFPGRPIMPGVLIIEAMAQTAGVLLLSKEENLGKLAYFLGINNVKFRKPVLPGDQLILEIDVIRMKSKTGQVRGVAKVKDKVVCEAELIFSLVEG
jgi:UDP-3-O-[3-hydroxymyristoyl] N-acetylglucosamine deacetylase/3-hydroxyacyl-[acyl-carrier-protein] dehydratase